MKMLLVAAGSDFADTIAYHLKPIGFEIEHIANPVRALERLDQVDPQAVLVHAGDFPRHWKPLLKMAREGKPKEELIFILAAPGDLEMEDAAKAAHLGVNGIVNVDLSDKRELYRLEEIIRRYRSTRDKRNFTRLVPRQPEELGFAFTHPRRLALVTGKVREISIQGSSFLPSRPDSVSDLQTGTVIRGCSLRIEDALISLACKVTRNRDDLGFQFLSFEEGGHHTLLKYIQSRSRRALKNATSQER